MTNVPSPGLPVDCDPVLKPTIVIAMVARTGSTQLCSMLGQLGDCGRPSEFLNPRGPMSRFAEAHGIQDMRTCLSTLASDAPIFCIKVTAIDWTPIADRAQAIFPEAQFAYLDRRDIDAQARSMARALHTGVCHVRQDATAQSPPMTVGDVPEELVGRAIPPGHYRRIAPVNVRREDGHARLGMCSGCPA